MAADELAIMPRHGYDGIALCKLVSTLLRVDPAHLPSTASKKTQTGDQ